MASQLKWGWPSYLPKGTAPVGIAQAQEGKERAGQAPDTGAESTEGDPYQLPTGLQTFLSQPGTGRGASGDTSRGEGEAPLCLLSRTFCTHTGCAQHQTGDLGLTRSAICPGSQFSHRGENEEKQEAVSSPHPHAQNASLSEQSPSAWRSGEGGTGVPVTHCPLSIPQPASATAHPRPGGHDRLSQQKSPGGLHLKPTYGTTHTPSRAARRAGARTGAHLRPSLPPRPAGHSRSPPL